MRLADEIKRLRNEGATLEQMGVAICDQGFHIEVTRRGFEQAGIDAKVKCFKVLFIPFVWLSLEDNTYYNALTDLAQKMIRMDPGMRTESVEEIEKEANELMSSHLVYPTSIWSNTLISH